MIDDSSSDDNDNDNGSDDFDIETAFDSISFIEQEFENQGKQTGQEIVRQRSYNDGYEIGATEGSKLGQELGFYHGFISHLQFGNMQHIQLSSKTQKSIHKISKQLNKLSLTSKYLNQNDIVLKESLQIIRSTFKSLLHSLNLIQQFQSLDTNNNSVPQSIKQMLKIPDNKSTSNNTDLSF